MNPELFRRAIPYLLTIATVLGCLWGAYRHGVSVTDTAWELKWNARRQTSIDEVRQHAEQQIARAEADAAAASAVAAGVHEQARRLAERASQCTSHPATAQPGSTNGQPAVVLAELLSRADARAGELAAAYDRARASGLACESAYLSLSAKQ